MWPRRCTSTPATRGSMLPDVLLGKSHLHMHPSSFILKYRTCGDREFSATVALDVPSTASHTSQDAQSRKRCQNGLRCNTSNTKACLALHACSHYCSDWSTCQPFVIVWVSNATNAWLPAHLTTPHVNAEEIALILAAIRSSQESLQGVASTRLEMLYNRFAYTT
jgi:hypothetical protein